MLSISIDNICEAVDDYPKLDNGATVLYVLYTAAQLHEIIVISLNLNENKVYKINLDVFRSLVLFTSSLLLLSASCFTTKNFI